VSASPPRRPTIVDVANLSGVSKSTVSNVLRGEGRMSSATRTRVLDAVARLGYRPNAAARDLVRRRTNLIGVVVGDLANTFYAELVKLLEVQASEAALTTIVCNTDGHLERERARVEALLEHGVSGVAMLQFSGDGVVLGELGAAGVPAVVVSCWDERADCVAVDDRAGLAAAVEHLVALGHSRIAHVTGPLLEEAARAARGAGYEAAMAAHGLAPVVVGPGDVVRCAADGCTAFTAGNDVMAVQLIDALEAEGLRVPGDVSVVGFDGIELGGHSRIALTTVAQPRAQLTTRGLGLLLERMHGAEGPARHVQLAPSLVVRGSSGPPP
jgi:DNA-binding LacI/PurR family transcriptional regulator